MATMSKVYPGYTVEQLMAFAQANEANEAKWDAEAERAADRSYSDEPCNWQYRA